jgi:ABC-type branched-subunit amino acid transport system substrate-binding protein
MRSQHIDSVTGGSTDTSMILLRREAKAQGYDDVKLWTCIPSCYSKNFLASADEVDGTYVTLGHLPFEEKDTNDDLAAFVESVGDKANGFGALAWQSADLFKQAVDAVVAEKGPNGLTRASLLAALAQVKDFDANGWGAKKATLKSSSPCFVIVQLREGAFHRVYPTKRGTLDCNPKNLVEFDLDPAAEAAKIP